MQPNLSIAQQFIPRSFEANSAAPFQGPAPFGLKGVVGYFNNRITSYGYGDPNPPFQFQLNGDQPNPLLGLYGQLGLINADPNADRGQLDFYNSIGTVNTGEGNDVLSVRNAIRSSVVVDMGNGDDTVRFRQSGLINGGGPDRMMELRGGDGFDTIEFSRSDAPEFQPTPEDPTVFRNARTNEYVRITGFENFQMIDDTA